MVVRITIKDFKQTISLLTSDDTYLLFIAGCSTNPNNLEELLVSVDGYKPGIITLVMADLMEFDKIVHQNVIHQVHEAIFEAREKKTVFEPAFQVIDEMTTQEAFESRACALVSVDLTAQTIQSTPEIEIPFSNEVAVGESTVMYILPKEWGILPL